MFLLTEIAPTIIFMVNTRTKPSEEMFEYEDATGKSYEMNQLQGEVGKSHLEYYKREANKF